MAARSTPLAARVLLFDVKNTHTGTGWYSCSRARNEQAGAVKERAHQVVREYRAHADRLDRDYAPAGQHPFADRLASFTNTRGLVVGGYCECSPDVHDLVKLAGARLAARLWRRLGARSEAEARGHLTAAARRRVGCLFARAHARHRQRRLPPALPVSRGAPSRSAFSAEGPASVQRGR